jgi:NTP pyrophosphatase (non-canonical NTP hydrolase)
MKYKIYHIPGVKIGCTTDIQKRVVEVQGYKQGEYEILFETDDLAEASGAERVLQEDLGYKVDMKPYKDLFKKSSSNTTKSKHTSSQATTTFKVSKQDIDAHYLTDLIIENEFGTYTLDNEDKIEWIISNVHASQFGPGSCYIYNKTLSQAYPFQEKKPMNKAGGQFICPLIREWAQDRGIYDKGDSKTQYIKLQEEAGELAQALLRDDRPEIIDAIGDMVVVLTNLAALEGLHIEDCIESAYDVIINRTGKMVNGTFKKDN